MGHTALRGRLENEQPEEGHVGDVSTIASSQWTSSHTPSWQRPTDSEELPPPPCTVRMGRTWGCNTVVTSTILSMY